MEAGAPASVHDPRNLGGHFKTGHHEQCQQTLGFDGWDMAADAESARRRLRLGCVPLPRSAAFCNPQRSQLLNSLAFSDPEGVS